MTFDEIKEEIARLNHVIEINGVAREKAWENLQKVCPHNQTRMEGVPAEYNYWHNDPAHVGYKCLVCGLYGDEGSELAKIHFARTGQKLTKQQERIKLAKERYLEAVEELNALGIYETSEES